MRLSRAFDLYDFTSLFNDKLEHLTAYAVLGLVGGLAFPTRRSRLWLLALLPLLAMALELGQAFAPGRSAEIVDAVASGAGAWLSLLPLLAMRSISNLIERDRA